MVHGLNAWFFDQSVEQFWNWYKISNPHVTYKRVLISKTVCWKLSNTWDISKLRYILINDSQDVEILKFHLKTWNHIFNFQVTEFPEQNIFGVKNIIGNVWEWTQDWWETKFTPTPKKNPVSAIIHLLLTIYRLSMFFSRVTIFAKMGKICRIFNLHQLN